MPLERSYAGDGCTPGGRDLVLELARVPRLQQPGGGEQDLPGQVTRQRAVEAHPDATVGQRLGYQRGVRWARPRHAREGVELLLAHVVDVAHGSEEAAGH